MNNNGQNPAGQPLGQASANNAPRPAQQPPLYRPEMMRSVNWLTEDEKIKYERGLQGLWERHDMLPVGSPEQAEAKKKIIDFGKVLLNKVQARRTQNLQQAAQQQAQQHAQQQQQMQQQQQQQQARMLQVQAGQTNPNMQQPQTSPTHPQQQQQARMLQVQASQTNPNMQQPQTSPTHPQQQQQNSPALQQQAQMSPTLQQQPQTNPATRGPAAGIANAGPGASMTPRMANQPNAAASKVPPSIINHVKDLQFQAPSGVPDPTKWIEDMKARYTKALVAMDNARKAMVTIDAKLAEASLAPADKNNLEEKKAQCTKQYQDAVQFANIVRKQYTGQPKPAQNGAAGAQNGGAMAATAGDANRPQPPSLQGTGPAGQVAGMGGASAPSGPVNALQTSAASINAAVEAAKKQQLTAARGPAAVNALGAQPRPPQQQQPQPGTQAANMSQAQATQGPSAPAPGAQVPQSIPVAPQPAQATAQQVAMPPQHPQSQNQQPQPQNPLKVEPGTQTAVPIPAPLNTAIAANLPAQPSAGTPTQNSARVQTPQSATPTGGSVAHPLSHAAAMKMAAGQRTNSNSGVATAASNTPASAPGMLNAAQQGHPHAHPQPAAQQQNQSAVQSKLLIPKTLPEKATQVPTPVPTIGGIGGGRPTYTGGGSMGGGVMNQPALTKVPGYSLEGEGERVLNKKKLDELVRQVCGGTAEGQEGNLLTPEVEESVLNLADSFVDSVLHQACRNAKERGSKVLEIRDIQLVLERTYNIRIPGYSSEELRTVRKVQPNASWIKKMSAVQAAKVVPGKGDL